MPAFTHFIRRFGKRVGIARVENDVGAGFGQGDRDGAAEAAAAAGDEGALSNQAELIEHRH